MNMKIKIKDNRVIVDYGEADEAQEFNFTFDEIVDLNDFILCISESDEKIECTPQSYEELKPYVNEAQNEVLKLTEYIYKIVDAFNESYDEIYLDEEEVYDDNSGEPEFDDDIPF